MLHALYFALIFPQVCDIAKFKSLVNYLEIKRHKKLKMKNTGFEAIYKAGGM